MATLIWRGDAHGTAQVVEVTFSDIEGGDQFSLTINRKTITVTASASLTGEAALLANVVSLFTAAINGTTGNNIPEWADLTASNLYDSAGDLEGLKITGASDGEPFTVTGTTGDAGNLGVDVAETVKGDPGKNEQQRITLPGTATGGTFTLSWDGQGPTATIAYNATAGTVQTALEGLSNITSGDVAVSGNAGGPWTVEFKQDYALEDVPLMTGDGSAITKGASDYTVGITETVKGDDGLNEIQRVTIEGSPTGGTFTLTFDDQGPTATIAYNASASTVQTALEGLSNIASGDVSVSLLGVGSWQVEFTGTYANTNVALLTGDGSSITGAAEITTSIVTEGAPATNEIQRVNFGFGDYAQLHITHPVSGLPYATLTFPGDASAAVVQANLEIITWLAGNVQVSYVDIGKWDVEFVGAYAGTSFALMTITGTTGTVTQIQDGGVAAVNEVQHIQLVGSPTGGSFTLSFRGQTTGSLTYDESAADVETALELLSTIATDDLTVTGDAGGPWTITFGGTLAGEDVPGITGTSSLTGAAVNVYDYQEATDATNEVQEVKIFGDPAGGTFTLSYDGQGPTSALTFDESAADIETALEVLSNIDDVEVTGEDGGPWYVEFRGTNAGSDVVLMTGSGASLSGAEVVIETTVAAVAAINEVETITLTGSPTGGTFTLTYDSQTTGNITYDATASAVRNALEGLSTVDVGEVDVSGLPGGPWTVAFRAGLGAQDVDDITGSGANLTATGTQAIVVSTTTTPTGPNHFDEANNWHNPAVPGTASAPAAGDTLYFRDSDVDCSWGLETNAGDTFAAVHVEASYTGKIGLDTHNGQYFEYRPLNLKCGITNLYVGEGEGSGSPRLRFDLESVNSTIEVWRTGTSEDDLPAMIYKGGGSSTALRVFRGSVGVAVGQAADTANLNALTVGYIDAIETDAVVVVDGVTTIATVEKSGGSLSILDGTVTAFAQEGGTTAAEGDTVLTTAVVHDGTLFYNSTGTITTLEVSDGGEVDFRGNQRPRTVTNATLYAGATLNDEFSTVTWTNPVVLDHCSLADVDVDFGTHRDYDVTDAP